MFGRAVVFSNLYRSLLTAKTFKIPVIDMVKKASGHKRVSRREAFMKNANKTFTIVDRKEKVQVLPPPIKSQSDKKEYRVIRLENGLTALLISDPSKLHEQFEESSSDDSDESEGSTTDASETSTVSGATENSDGAKGVNNYDEEKMAAVALSVGVGSFSDPPDIQGLAHFVEHMVFMGSVKYPKENDFDAFIKKKGGSDNASTDCERTTFYFEIQEKHLQQAMDKFSQFFVSPLLVKEAMQREREAIQSEFAMAAPSDVSRKEQLLSYLFPPGHPARTFTWGNIKSLKDMVPGDDYLYEKAHDFRRNHYSAHRMNVAIQARYDLDTLQRYVVNTFGQILNNRQPADDFSAHNFTSPEQVTKDFASLYYMKPIADVTELHLTWLMPPLFDVYQSKPHQYLSYLLGHEGEGSLLSYLKKKVWALGLYAGNDETGLDYTSIYSMFSVQVILTEQGLENVDSVVTSIFEYLNMLRHEGPSERIFQEIKAIEETNFRFEEESMPADYVEELAENMFLFPPEHYITGDRLYYKYDANAISNIFNYMTADKVNLLVLSNKHKRTIEYDRTEEWFGTQYRKEDIPPSWIEKWSNAIPDSSLHLPEENVFIARDFDLIPIAPEYQKVADKLHIDLLSTSNKDLQTNLTLVDDEELTVTLRDEDFSTTVKKFRLEQPNLLRKNRLMEVWYKPDFKFRLPTALLYFYFITPLSLRSARDQCLLDVWSDFVNQELKETVYPASMAGLSANVYPSELGIMLKINGYSQNLHLLSDVVTKGMTTAGNRANGELLSAICELRARAYHNILIKPGKLNKFVRMQVLLEPYFSPSEKAEHIRNITLNDFLEFNSKLMQKFYVKVLLQGNLKWSQALRLAENAYTNINWTAVPTKDMPMVKVREIPVGEKIVRVKSLNKDNTNTVVTNYYQSGPTNSKEVAILEVLIMLIEEPLFDRLRTKEQLGYSVSGTMRNTYNIIGYSVTINTQADKFSPEHVDERVEKFIEWFVMESQKKSEKKLAVAKQALLKLKHSADLELTNEARRHWSEITSDDYCFNRLKIEADAIEKLTVNDVREFLDRNTKVGNGTNFRKLSIQVVGFEKPKAEQSTSSPNGTVKSNSMSLPGKYNLEYLEEGPGDFIKDVNKFKSTLKLYDRIKVNIPNTTCICKKSKKKEKIEEKV